MLRLNNITLTQFKNYSQNSFDFSGNIIAIYGKNGAGKTNLLDAIHYLSFTKSYFGSQDTQQVQTGCEGFRITGDFSLKENIHPTNIVLRESGKKEVGCNGVLYEKFSAHLGRFPVVMIAPDDIELINSGSEIRRRFLDTLLCQTDTDYLQALIRYNRVLQQRNSYLKQAAVLKRKDEDLLETLDEQLSSAGTIIYEKRQAFAPVFKELILNYYLEVSGTPEKVDFFYESQLAHQSLETLLKQYREKDYILQRTNCGIHKDNLDLLLDQQPFKNRGSQGQKKSLLFALKLAEAATLTQKKGFSPILLLDDVFEKLDTHRMTNLLLHICRQMKSQLFLTDTHRERIEAVFQQIGMQVDFIEIGKD
ncbi:MAG: DNA replication and repair protein RecF [Bacteroidetes bacterium]|nr:DNA replication and repair protein RecF [Bacteroidota bacterium]